MNRIRKVLKLFGNKYVAKDAASKRNSIIEDLYDYEKI